MSVMDAADATVPADWRVTSDGTVPVADVVRSAGVPHGAIDYPVRLGLIVLAAAALAMAAGVALVAILKAMKTTGAQITPSGLTIPFKDLG
jgi:hypothetical protein